MKTTGEKKSFYDQVAGVVKGGNYTAAELEAYFMQKMGVHAIYDVNGNYDYMGDKHYFRGFFRINRKGDLLGRTEESQSASKWHLIVGEAKVLSGGVEINFVKMPANAMLGWVYYTLAKPENVGEDQYTGHYDARYELGQAPEGRFAIKDGKMVSPEESNVAEFKLTR